MANAIKTELLKRIQSVEENVSLQRFNQLGVGGTADFFTEVHDTVELIEAVKAAIGCSIPYFVVGMGTSILFSDGGFPGIVIHNLAEQHVVVIDQSQMIVDSGMSLQQFITQAASQGFGGLTALYPCGGTVGGAIYHNAEAAGQSIMSSIRYVTLLLPPTKMKVDVSVVRYRADWFFKDSPAGVRLRDIQRGKSLEEHRPIILNAHIQLTSVRSDELLRRVHHQAKQVLHDMPKGMVFGPLFLVPENVQLQDLFKQALVDKIRVEHLFLDRHNPNFMRRKKAMTSSQAVWEYVELIRQTVKAATGVELESVFERVGSW